MPHDDNGGGSGEAEAPVTNAFGDDVKDGVIVPQGGTEESGGADDKGKKKEEKPTEVDISKHPAFVELKTLFDDYKRTTGENLSNQGRIIEDLRKGKKDEGGAGGDDNALFKNIKRSKDLTDEEREGMTETEIKQMDSIADMQEGMNKMASMLGKKETANVEDRNKAVRTLATTLAKESSGKDDTELANQIIENFNLFDQTKIPADKVEEFVKRAATQVSTYKPPKEQKRVSGAPVKKGGDGGTDPFGVDAIVEEASKRSTGGAYAL